MQRELVYVLPEETRTSTFCTLEDWLKTAERRGDEEFKIQTNDGFTVYESYVKQNKDGTKKIIVKNYLKDDELTPKEAIEAMLNKECLVDYKHYPDEAMYRWNGYNFIVYDDYVFNSERIIKSFTGLRHYIPDKKRNSNVKKFVSKKYLALNSIYPICLW